MPQMTGGQALIRSMRREGAEVVFGLPGVQMYHAADPILDEPGMRFIAVRHEQATAYMADGFTRAGGGTGTAMVVPGPGLLNAAAGIGTAYAASSPILVVSGQVQRDLIGKDVGILHEVNDQQDAIRPITKAAFRVLNAADVPAAVHEAFRELRTGRPRPVEIEMPPEALAESADVDLLEPGAYRREAASDADVERAARALADAKVPIVWAGGGAVSSGASDALLRVAEHLQAPVMTTHEGKGAIPDSHYLSMGSLKSRADDFRAHLAHHDVFLAVGTRFATTQLTHNALVVQIDVDPDEIGRNFANTLGVVGDAKGTLEKLAAALEDAVPPAESKRAMLEKLRAARFGPTLRIEPLDSYLRAVRAAIPPNGILVAGMTQLGYYSRLFYPVERAGTYLNSSYFGNLGFAWPTAIGAKAARPERAVVAVSGDGGFLFNSQELATAVQHGINAVVVVFNDNAYGNVLRDLEERFDGRVVGARLRNPDFVKLAEAYGARGLRVESPAALEAALRSAVESDDAPTLIEVPFGPVASPL